MYVTAFFNVRLFMGIFLLGKPDTAVKFLQSLRFYNTCLGSLA